MSAVADVVSDVFEGVGDAVGDVIEFVGDVGQDIIDVTVDAVEDVGEFIGDTVEAALDDPIGTIATITTAVYAPYLLPAVSAGRVVANGGDLEDALKAAATSYVAQGVGSYVGNQVGTALNYGTDLGSSQTAMLAAQSGDMLGGTLGGTVGNLAGSTASGLTAGVLTGRDPIEMALNALGTAGIRLGQNYVMNAAGQLIDDFGNVIADSNQVEEIPNPAGEGDIGYGYRYFNDGTVIDPQGNYYQDNSLIWSPSVTEIENFSQPGDEGYGWRYFSDGTVISPEGEYYNQEGEIIWSPSITEVGMVEPSVDEFVDASVTEPVTEPVTEIPNPAQEGQEGYGWRYFSDGTVMDPEGRYMDTEGNILWEPGGEITFDNLVDPKLVEGAKDYLKKQFTGQISRSLSGSLNELLFGSPKGRQALAASRKAGVAPTYENLSALGFGGLFQETPEVDTGDEFSTQTTEPIEGLFNPVSSMEWAPQTKLGGLGPSGKYVNLESDVYYPNKDQEQKQKAKEALNTRGWLTSEEEAALGDEGGSYFDYDPTNYNMAPWLDTIDEMPVYAAEGGLIEHNPEFYSEGGASITNRYVKGNGDGTSDSVPAMLASGEFVIPADVVSSLGNGDNDAGAQVLDKFMVAIRKHKRDADPKQLPPDSKGPLSYLADAMK